MLTSRRSPCVLTRKICRLYSVLQGKPEAAYTLPHTHAHAADALADSLPLLQHSAETSATNSGSKSFALSRAGKYEHAPARERLVLLMVEEALTLRDVDCLPPGVALPLREALRAARYHAPGHWPAAAYVLVGREDLAQTAEELCYTTALPKLEGMCATHSLPSALTFFHLFRYHNFIM